MMYVHPMIHQYVRVHRVSSYINVVKDEDGDILRLEFHNGVESDLDWLEFVERDRQYFYIDLYTARRNLGCDIKVAGNEWQTRANLSALEVLSE